MTMSQRASKVGVDLTQELAMIHKLPSQKELGSNPGSCVLPTSMTEAFSRLAEPHVSRRCNGASSPALEGGIKWDKRFFQSPCSVHCRAVKIMGFGLPGL